MAFVDDTILIPIRIKNPFLGLEYPESGNVHAVLDTGFTGFLLVPEAVFTQLGFSEMRSIEVEAVTADSRTVRLRGVYGTIIFPDVNLSVDGLIETGKNVQEILLGVRGVQRLRLYIDSCNRVISYNRC